MKKLFISIVVLSSFVFASSPIYDNSTYNLYVKKGWQLLGFPYAINDMSLFDNSNVSLLWKYDNTKKIWQGYSNDSDIKTKLKDKNITTISNIEHFNGVWIHSTKDWYLSIPKLDSNNIDTDSNNTIALIEGWNLISIPAKNVYSSKLFEGFDVWKYEDQNWSINSDSKLYPKIQKYNAGEAVWVLSETNTTIDINKQSAKLFNFSSQDELKEYIRDMTTAYNRPYFDYYYVDFIEPAFAMDDVALETSDTSTNVKSDTATNTSSTNTQEKNVDEADIIKHNGDAIFYINTNQSKISVTQFKHLVDDNVSKYEENLTIQLNQGSRPIEAYLINDQLIVISNFDNWYNYYEPMVDEYYYPKYYYSEPKTLIDIFNINDINNITHTKQLTMSGTYKDSRLTNGKLYFISEFYPHIEVEYEKKYLDNTYSCNSINSYEEAKKCYGVYKDENGSYKYDYDNYTVTKEYLVPQLYENNTSVDLIKAPNFYSSMKLNQNPNITTVTQIDVNSTQIDKSISILGYMNTIYASKESLYMTSDQYPIYFTYDDYKHQLALYKLSLEDNLTYKAMGYIEGRTLNQFSLSEYNSTLRVATTQGTSWSDDGTNNRVYTLQENNATLEVQGILENLGEERERIFAVRFIGQRGYVVTFRETDPFYTLDLSNPLNPKKVGELKIDGVSTYLHPINDDLILSIGRLNWGEFKLELFDVSDFSNPTSSDRIIIDNAYYSGNHKSYTFRNNLLSMALRVYDTSSYNYNSKINGYLFNVDTDTQSLKEKLSTSLSDTFYSGVYYTRSIIYDFKGKSYITFFNQNSIKTETFTTD